MIKNKMYQSKLNLTILSVCSALIPFNAPDEYLPNIKNVVITITTFYVDGFFSDLTFEFTCFGDSSGKMSGVTICYVLLLFLILNGQVYKPWQDLIHFS